jgi:hypothetical protein
MRLMIDHGIRTDDPTHRPPPERALRTQTNRIKKVRPTTRPNSTSPRIATGVNIARVVSPLLMNAYNSTAALIQ